MTLTDEECEALRNEDEYDPTGYECLWTKDRERGVNGIVVFRRTDDSRMFAFTWDYCQLFDRASFGPAIEVRVEETKSWGIVCSGDGGLIDLSHTPYSFSKEEHK